MLTALGTGLRFRLAITLATIAAVCFTLPPAVLAMGHGTETVNCLSHVGAMNHGMTKMHEAAQPQAHDTAHLGAAASGDPAPAPAHRMNCCGLYCLSAMPASSDSLDRLALGLPHGTAPAPLRAGGVPNLPERPPNTLLSI